MAYQEPKPRSIRLDDDVYEALQKLPESPNKFLRRMLSANGVFESARFPLPGGKLGGGKSLTLSSVSEHPGQTMTVESKSSRRELRPKGDSKR